MPTQVHLNRQKKQLNKETVAGWKKHRQIKSNRTFLSQKENIIAVPVTTHPVQTLFAHLKVIAKYGTQLRLPHPPYSGLWPSLLWANERPCAENPNICDSVDGQGKVSSTRLDSTRRIASRLPTMNSVYAVCVCASYVCSSFDWPRFKVIVQCLFLLTPVPSSLVPLSMVLLRVREVLVGRMTSTTRVAKR